MLPRGLGRFPEITPGRKTPVTQFARLCRIMTCLKDTIPKTFKMVFNIVESFRNKRSFYSGCKKFWVVQNSFSIVTKLNKNNVKKTAKSISFFDFSKLYTTIPYKFLLKMLSEVINFVYKSKVGKELAFLKHLFIGLPRELEEYTSLNKLLSMLCLSS